VVFNERFLAALAEAKIPHQAAQRLLVAQTQQTTRCAQSRSIEKLAAGQKKADVSKEFLAIGEGSAVRTRKHGALAFVSFKAPVAFRAKHAMVGLQDEQRRTPHFTNISFPNMMLNNKHFESGVLNLGSVNPVGIHECILGGL